MKRSILLSFCAFLLASAACESETEPAAPVQLAPPVLSTGDITASSFTVNWGKVENAVVYAYQLDDGQERATQNLHVAIGNLTTGEHKVRVKAISNRPDLFSESPWAEASVTLEAGANVTQLATPELSVTGQTENSLVISWKAVDHADRYAYVLDEGEEAQTDKLFAAFPHLSPGTHTVRVKAVSDDPDNYSDSPWGEITATISVGEAMLEVVLSLDELQPQNVVFANIRTQRCEALYAGALESGISQENAIARLTSGGYALGIPEVAVANTIQGYDKEIRGLMPDTEYAVCVYARYENGTTAFFSGNITTVAVPEMDPELAAWIGSYTVTSTEVIRFKGPEGATSGMPTSYSSSSEPMTFDITIRAYAKDTKYVEIIDWCQIDYLAPWPMLAQLHEEGGLALLTAGVNYGTIDGYSAQCAAFLLLENGEIAPVTNLPFSFIFKNDGTSIRSSAVTGTANGQSFVSYATDVIGKDPLYGSMYFYELPKDIPAGEFTLVRKADPSSAAPQAGRTPTMCSAPAYSSFATVAPER